MVRPIDTSLEPVRTFLNDQNDIRLSIVFGSAVTGRQTPESDLDIAVLARASLTSERKQKLVQALAGIVERPVDLIDLSTVGEPLLGRILHEGRRLSGSSDTWAAILSRHLIDAADFLPYRERMLEERRASWTRP
jgi:predicted nucleotidyltransferase